MLTRHNHPLLINRYTIKHLIMHQLPLLQLPPIQFITPQLLHHPPTLNINLKNIILIIHISIYILHSTLLSPFQLIHIIHLPPPPINHLQTTHYIQLLISHKHLMRTIRYKHMRIIMRNPPTLRYPPQRSHPLKFIRFIRISIPKHHPLPPRQYIYHLI